MSRWMTVVLVFGLLAIGILYDRVDFAPEPELVLAEPAVVTPKVAAEDRLANVWFCAVGSGEAGGYATHELAISNVGDEAAVANVDLITNEGPGPGLRFEIAPFTTEIVDLASIDASPGVGAVVEVINGVGMVGHTVRSSQGVAQGPCATETSETWYFADGVTTRDSSAFIALLNPFPEDVVFNASFQTATRSRIPSELQSAVVPGRSVRIIDVGQYVAREPNVATTIETVQGRLVAERLQTFNGDLGPTGVALTLGVPDPALQWELPAGRVQENGDQRIVIFNPTEDLAELDVLFELDPQDRSSYGLVPIEVSVLAGRSVVLDLRAMVTDFGLPLPYEFGSQVRSANGVPVVVERWQVTPQIDVSLIGAGGAEARTVRLRRQGANEEQPAEEQPAEEQQVEEPQVGGQEIEGEVPEEDLAPEPVREFAQPTAEAGVAVSRGVQVESSRWLLPWVSLGSADSEEAVHTVVVASGPEGTIVEVQLMLAGELLPPIRGTVTAAGVVAISIPAAVDAAPMIIAADAPVIVEAQVVAVGRRLDVVAAVPVLEEDP